jgi:hypothetical protein
VHQPKIQKEKDTRRKIQREDRTEAEEFSSSEAILSSDYCYIGEIYVVISSSIDNTTSQIEYLSKLYVPPFSASFCHRMKPASGPVFLRQAAIY